MAQLRACDLFSEFPETELVALASRMTLRSYAKGQTVYARCDRANAFYLVVEGRVRLSVVSPEGREFTVLHKTPGEYFGEVGLLDGLPSAVDANAVTPARIATMAPADFLALLREHPRMDRALMQELVQMLRSAVSSMEALALLPLEARLARLILQFARRGGDGSNRPRFELDIPQGELAAMVGGSRPKVSHMLHEWHENGIVVREGREVTVDIDLLTSLSLRANSTALAAVSG
jgi:CRP-like cAMP-binding protein